MIASVLRLSRLDVAALEVIDAYSLHRVVYDLFDDVRNDDQKRSGVSSGVLYADKGGDFHSRRILVLSARAPLKPEYGELEIKEVPENLLNHERYRFEIIVNPTKRDGESRKIIAIRGREEVMQWFANKAPESWGFTVYAPTLQVNNLSVKEFKKKGHSVTLGSATLQGHLTVKDRAKFIKSFHQGIGRGRAFGFGLLQIVPHSNL